LKTDVRSFEPVRLLIVDLLAERHGFGREGVAEIIRHFRPNEVYLWSPHISDRLTYEVGKVVEGPVEADAIVITGSRRNVTSWEPWMDDVVELIRGCDVPLYGICFGHQIIAKAFGGTVVRAPHSTDLVGEVRYADGHVVHAAFAHQDHVVDAGELVPLAQADHCGIVACMHPTRPIRTVQFHPELTEKVLAKACETGEMTTQEVRGYAMERVSTDVTTALLLLNGFAPSHERRASS
jgi:GMP synthase-like glutamine amidotransferase